MLNRLRPSDDNAKPDDLLNSDEIDIDIETIEIYEEENDIDNKKLQDILKDIKLSDDELACTDQYLDLAEDIDIADGLETSPVIDGKSLPQYEKHIQKLINDNSFEFHMLVNEADDQMISMKYKYNSIYKEQMVIPLAKAPILHDYLYVFPGLSYELMCALEKYTDENLNNDLFKDAVNALIQDTQAAFQKAHGVPVKYTIEKLTPLNHFVLKQNSSIIEPLLNKYKNSKIVNAMHAKYKEKGSFSDLNSEEKITYLNYQYTNTVTLTPDSLYNIISKFDSFLKIEQAFSTQALSIVNKIKFIKTRAEKKNPIYDEIISNVELISTYHELFTNSETLNFETQKDYYLLCKKIYDQLPILCVALNNPSPELKEKIDTIAIFIKKLKALTNFYEKCNAMPKKDFNKLPSNIKPENLEKLKTKMGKDLKKKALPNRIHPAIPTQYEYDHNPALPRFKNALIAAATPNGVILSFAPAIKVRSYVATVDNQIKEQENYNKVINILTLAQKENDADFILLQKIPVTIKSKAEELGKKFNIIRDKNGAELLTYYNGKKFELLKAETILTENSGSVLSLTFKNKKTNQVFDILNVCGRRLQDPKKAEHDIKQLASSSSRSSTIMGHINANIAPHGKEENIINHTSCTFPNGSFSTTDGGENFTQLKTQNLDVDTGRPVKNASNEIPFDPSYFPIMNLDQAAREALVIDNKSLIEYEKHIQALFNDPRIEFNMAANGSNEKAILIKLPNDNRYNALLKLINESGINCTNHDNSAHQIFVPLEQANLLHKQICINKSQESEKIAYLKSQVLTQFKIDNTYIKENQSDVSSSFSHTKHISVKRILSIETHSYEDYRKLLQLELEALNEKNTTISRVLKHCLLLDKNPPSTPKKTRIVTLTSNASLEVLKYIDSKEKSLPYRLFSSDSDQSSAELKLAGKLAHDLAKCKDSKSLVNFTLKISKLLSQGKITPDSDLANIFYDLMKNARQYIMEYNDVLLRETRKTKNKTILQDIQVEGGDLLNTYLVKQENSWFKEANFNQIFDAILLLNRLLNCKAEDLKSVYVDLCVCKSDSEKSPKLDSVYSKIITNIENKLRKDGLERSCVAWKKTAGEAIAIRNPEKSSLRL